MLVPPLNQRFLASSRGKILQLLRRSARTVDELVQALGLTENAVRSQLAILERDGLVRQGESRRRARKPAYTYELSPRAESMFPRAYEVIVNQLLNELAVEIPAEQKTRILWNVGRRLAAQQPAPSGDLRTRLAVAVMLLNQLGGLMEVEEEERRYTVCGYSCPLGGLTRQHPEVCTIPLALLAELLRAPVRERCERSEALACRFEVAND